MRQFPGLLALGEVEDIHIRTALQTIEEWALLSFARDHDSLGGLADDDHSQYLSLVAREVEQVVNDDIFIDESQLTVGDGTNETVIEADGDVIFTGTAGLPFAEISVVGNSTETAIAVAGTAVQVTIFDTNGPSNNGTPDHTNDHITIVKAGHYFIAVSATINSVGGPGSKFELTVQKNNGAAEIGALHCDRDIAGGGGVAGVISMSGIVDLAVSDTIEVWIENETNTANYVVEDITLSLFQLGGT